MNTPQGVPIARIPTGQSVDLFTAVGHLLDAALGGAMLAQGNGHDVAATVIARDGQTERQAVAALRRAAEALGAEDLAPLVDDEPDDGPGVTVGPLRHDEHGWTASLGGTATELAQQVMAVLVPAFEAYPDAINYLSWDAVYQPTGGKYSLILVRPDGLTPHEARQQADEEAERLRGLLAESVELLDSTIDQEPCRIDHNQNCQEHSWFDWGKSECNNARIRRFVAEHSRADQDEVSV